MEEREIRLRIVEAMIPQASRVGVTDPTAIIESCAQLEKYVLDSLKREELPTSQPRKILTRPEKTTEKVLPGFLDPARGG